MRGKPALMPTPRLPWGSRSPLRTGTRPFAQVEVSDLSGAASGVYERHFVRTEKNHHHILDPSTCPYDNGLISVTILSERSETETPFHHLLFPDSPEELELAGIHGTARTPASSMRIIRSTIPTNGKFLRKD